MVDKELEDIEIDLLLEGIYRRYGYDFRSYARASLERRLRQFLSNGPNESISELIPKVLHDEAFFATMAQALSVSTTHMFRDPQVYRAIREKILPVLRTWPHFKIWHAGCSTGEEAYSLAILLHEELLLDRATIYATDFNDASLTKAKDGIYAVERVKEFTKAHHEAGGKTSFADYYQAAHGLAAIRESLRKRITFANHNLAVDHAFSEMHLVVCRNVMIYFNRELQNRVLRIFSDTLVNGGFLCLGNKEDLRFSDVASDFETVDGEARIYKKLVAR
jgi:chemotaxis protein methyltransferase CheR